MKYNIGDHVMYVPVGVCTVMGCAEKCFDGKTKRSYIELVPEAGAKTVCYLPSEVAEEKLRELKSAEEVNSLIAEIPQIPPCQEAARGDRRVQFSEILRSDDTRQMLSLIKLLHRSRCERENAGKNLSTGEENALRAALTMVSQEFALALGITESEAAERICGRLAG